MVKYCFHGTLANVKRIYFEFYFMQIATYRTIKNIDVRALKVSIGSVADLIRCYGADLLTPDDSPNNTTQSSNKRKLYNSNQEGDDLSRQNGDGMTVSHVLEIYLDMLDDEVSSLKVNSGLYRIACNNT